jgi:hypothetical protein
MHSKALSKLYATPTLTTVAQTPQVRSLVFAHALSLSACATKFSNVAKRQV